MSRPPSLPISYGIELPSSGYGGGKTDDQMLRSLMLEYLTRARGAGELRSNPLTETWTRGNLIHHHEDPVFVRGETISAIPHVYPANPPNLDLFNFATLEGIRSDVASLARFGQRVDFATFHLCVALDGAPSNDFWKPAPRVRRRQGAKSWYSSLAEGIFSRYRSLRSALLVDWTPPEELEPLRVAAFLSLCDLTPADSQLRVLFVHDRSRAFHELARHLDVVANQLEITAKLAEDLSEETLTPSAQDDERRRAIQDSLLEQAGETYSLTEAAAKLGTSRQNLHKRIKSGSALGLMRAGELAIPAAQFIESPDGARIIPHLRDVLSPFEEARAGSWSCLQFLVEPDPNMGRSPFEVLREGDHPAVVTAARAYLGLDED